jgi:hypothetical protein
MALTMNPRVASLSISPPHSLIVMAGHGAADTPIPDGVLTAFGSDDTLIVMTQYEHLGPTTINVSVRPSANWPPVGLREVFDGPIRSPGGTFELRNVLQHVYRRFHVGTDKVRVRVAVDRELEPRRIDIALG